jgi:adenylate kinase
MVTATGQNDNLRFPGLPGNLTGRCGTAQPNRIIIFIGAPGSGKGTQSSLLASRFGIACISTGTILREESKKNTPAGFRLRQTMATGALVDDQTVCEAVVSRIRDLDDKSQASLILDGFPRTVAQAKSLDHVLESLGLPGPVVVHLDVSNDVLLHRLARRRQCAECGAIYNLASGESGASGTSNTSNMGTRCHVDGGALVERDDDREGVVARRLTAYGLETLPVVEYYQKRGDRNGLYRRIDGNLGAAEIANDVCDLVLLADTALAA